MIDIDKYNKIKLVCDTHQATLLAVSKLKPVADINTLYELGHRDFGENYVQELVEKETLLPKDINWHFIGHLQTNKVKYIAAFIHLIQSVDSEKMLIEINKQAKKNNRIINVLLQVHIAEEETKYGFNASQLKNLPIHVYTNVQVVGLMGMATFTDDKLKLKTEFETLKNLYITQSNKSTNPYTTLSMGMSDDYALALECGSNMIRIGSMLFGVRQ